MTAIDVRLEAYLDDTAERRLQRYLEFLRIPSISTLPEHAGDVRQAANWLADQLMAIGVRHVAVEETGGHPVVYGDWLSAENAPTAIVYGHYDVQPVDPLDLWESPPFAPLVKGERVQARGSSDDKGQIMIHLPAVEALLATRGALPINLKFIFEGEEESGSEHLDAWLEANRDRLSADLAVISDTSFFDGNVPAITIGLRGLCAAQIDVIGPSLDLHSGTYGGTVENPIFALATILASLKGPDGRIRVPGFYEAVKPLSDLDRESFRRLPFDEPAYLELTGSPSLAGEAGFTTLERRGARPTLEVNGVWGGFQGEGTKTIIPAHAHAKITCRLVPDQRPEVVFERLRGYVEEIAPPSVRVDVKYLGGGLPSLTPIDHSATRAAAIALEATFGSEPLYVREGGSIPVANSFERILGLPVVLLGFTPPDDHAHAPNEYMNLRNQETAIRTVIRLWDELAVVAESEDGAAPRHEPESAEARSKVLDDSGSGSRIGGVQFEGAGG